MGWHNRRDTHTCQCCVLTYDFVPGRALPPSPCFSASSLYSFLHLHILHRAASATNSLALQHRGSYPRYARKLLRNVVLGAKVRSRSYRPRIQDCYVIPLRVISRGCRAQSLLLAVFACSLLMFWQIANRASEGTIRGNGT